jgi:hypothetical protein
MSLPAGRKRLSAAKMHPLDDKKVANINGLGIMWPSSPAAEFSAGFAVSREAAAEFATRPLACLFSIKAHP